MATHEEDDGVLLALAERVGMSGSRRHARSRPSYRPELMGGDGAVVTNFAGASSSATASRERKQRSAGCFAF